MEFPFGRRHHHGGEEEEEGRRRREEPHYPPPGQQPYGSSEPYGGRVGEYQRPPPHYGGPEGAYYGEDARRGQEGYAGEYQRPPPRHGGPEGGYYGEDARHGAPPAAPHQPGYPAVQHVAHEVGMEEGGGGERYDGRHQGHQGGPFSFFHHGSSGGAPANKGTVRVFSKAEENYSLSIRDGKVVLARTDPNDEYQHWIKDEKFSTKVKDEEGLPCFALVNKVTGEAIKHSAGATHPVRLVHYKPDYLDESILWTESHDTGEGFRCIRMVNNIRLNFDALNGDKDHGGVRDGTIIVLWEWMKGENQRWKIVPY
uniref:Protein ssh4 n=1 Tax=Anthurium amnicola TaxID=1678845 RepID=A0A1D1Y9T0_9ARAE